MFLQRVSSSAVFLRLCVTRFLLLGILLDARRSKHRSFYSSFRSVPFSPISGIDRNDPTKKRNIGWPSWYCRGPRGIIRVLPRFLRAAARDRSCRYVIRNGLPYYVLGGLLCSPRRWRTFRIGGRVRLTRATYTGNFTLSESPCFPFRFVDRK